MKRLLVSLSAILLIAVIAVGVSVSVAADEVHSYGEWIGEIPATCQEDGVLGHYHCADCGGDFDAEFNAIDSLTIPARGHYYLVDTTETVNTFRVDSSYSFSYDESTGIYSSTNKSHSSTGTLYLVAECDAYVEIAYQVSSEGSCDVFYFYKNGTNMFSISGTYSSTLSFNVSAGDILEFRYRKDGSVHRGSDMGWFSFVSGSTSEIGNVEEVPIEGAEALCDRDIICASCNTLFFEALGHDMITRERLEPTCTERGYEAYETCSRCDNGEKVWIEPTGHSYSETVTVEPTCLEQGYTAEVCHCGEILNRYDYVSTISHTYGEWVEPIAPTCTEDGNVGYYPCTACGSAFDSNYYMLETEVVPARGHWVTVPSVETVDALQYVTKSSFSASSPYNGGYSTNKSNNSSGYIRFNVLYDCSLEVSYGVYSETSYDWFYININGSQYTRISGSKSYTTTLQLSAGDTLEFRYSKDGSQSRSHDQGYYNIQSGRYVEIDTTEDIPIETMDSKCLEDIVCSCCGETIKPAVGHDIVQYEYQAPTCTEVGWEAYEACSRCDLTTYVEIPATGHSHESTVTEPTCVDQGYTTHTCHCGDTYIDTYVNARGHYYGEWIPQIDAGCETEGVVGHYTCSVCGLHFNRDYYQIDNLTISPIGHHIVGGEIRTETAFVYNGYQSNFELSDDGWYYSTNHTSGSYAYVEFRAAYTTNVQITLRTTGEYDDCNNELCIYVNGNLYDKIVGLGEEKTVSIPLYSGNYVVVQYENKGTNIEDDVASFTIVSGTEVEFDDRYYTGVDYVYPTCEDAVVCASCQVEFKAALGHDMISYEYQAPTCTEVGWEAYEACSRCDLTTYVEIPATGHSYEATVTDPTCTEQGYTTYVCSVCSDTYVSDYVSSLGHSYTGWVERLDPTCTEDGYLGHNYCDRCQHYLDDSDGIIEDIVLNALGHYVTIGSYENVQVLEYADSNYFNDNGNNYYSSYNHNDSSQGYISFNVLHDSIVSVNYGVSSENNFDYFRIYKNGSQLYYISGSYSNIVADITVSAGDVLTFYYTKDGSVRSGSDYGWFTITSGLYTEIDTREMVSVDDAEPTCENAIICESCGVQFKDALGHDILQYDAQAPTCTEVGWEAYEACSRCDLTTYVEIPATGHNHEESVVVTDPTCTEQGYTTHTCHCGDYYVDTYTDAIGHAYGEWIPQVDAGCETQGAVGHYACLNCGLYFNRDYLQIEDLTISPIGHHIVGGEIRTETAFAPSGYYSYFELAEDGWYYSNNHSSGSYASFEFYASYNTNVQITLRTTGEYDCANQLCIYVNGSLYDKIVGLGEEKTVNVPLYAGNYVIVQYENKGTYIEDDVASFTIVSGTEITIDERYYTSVDYVDPTCENAVVCASCQVEFKAALGHDMISYEYQAPTCTDIGWEAYEACSRCELTSYVEIPATGHSHEPTVTDPTCTEQGYTTYVCSACSDTYVNDYVSSLGHSYTGWVERLDPTCTEDGYLGHNYCDRCQHYLDESDGIIENIVLPALGHYVIVGSHEIVTMLELSSISGFTGEGNSYTSTNHGVSTYSDIYFNVLHSGRISISYGVSSESNCDWFQVYHNDNRIDRISGYANRTVDIDVTEGDYIRFRYSKDYSVNNGSDCGWFTITSGLQVEVDTREMVSVDIAEPTCENAIICESCGVEFKAALGHDMQPVEALDPTCTEIGWEAYEQCSRCDHNTKVEIQALGHDHIPTVTDPTCTEQGYTTHVCSRCDDTYIDSYVSELGHDYRGWLDRLEPTCTEDGYIGHDYCNRCGLYFNEYYSIVENVVIQARGHYVAVGSINSNSGFVLGDDGYFYSTNKRDYSSSSIEIVLAKSGYFMVDYRVSSESGFDWITIYHNGVTLAQNSGEYSGSCAIEANAGDIIIVTYSKDGSASRGSDAAYFRIGSLVNNGIDNFIYVSVDNVEPTCTEGVVCDSCLVEFKEALGHDLYDVEAQAPGCETIGWETYQQCSRCEHNNKLEIEPHGHSFTPTVFAPTCTEQGYTAEVCDYCQIHGEVFDYVDATGHNYEYNVYIVEPTCTEEGYTRHECHCGDYYGEEYIPVIDHSYDAVEIVDPTCDEEGYTKHICVCGDYYTDTYVAALGHNLEEYVTVIDPTCTEMGYTRHTCHCGEFYDDAYTDALGHDYELNVSIVDPWCETQGYTRHMCRCGEYYDDNYVDALGHDHEINVNIVEPWCDSQGYTRHSCRCGQHYDDSYVDALGHNFELYVSVVDPWCESEGFTRHSCRCGQYYDDSYVDALGHDFEYNVVIIAPTCEGQGYTAHNCRCGLVQTDNHVPATGHSHVAIIIAPTCEEQGYTSHECSCGDTYVDTYVEPTGHSHIHITVIDPTCSEQGYTKHECDCGNFIQTDFVVATGHTYGSWSTYIAPTCTEYGEDRRYCINCDDEYQFRAVQPTGHSNSNGIVTHPTCTEEGYTTYTCHCGYTFVSDYTSTVPHTMGQWEVITYPTCTQSGENCRWCIDCGQGENEIIPANGHSHEAFVVEPTCTQEGYTEYICVCGDVYTDDIISPLGHSYDGNSDEYCNNCGEYREVEGGTSDETTAYETEAPTEVRTEIKTEHKTEHKTEKPEETTDYESEITSGEETEPNTEEDSEYITEEITTKPKKDNEEDDDDDSSSGSGCFSTISGGAFALIIGLAATVGVVFKKKED